MGAHPPVLAVAAPRRPGVAAAARRDGLARAAGGRHYPPAPELVEASCGRSPRFPRSPARIRLGATVSDVAREGMDRTRTAGRARRRSCCAAHRRRRREAHGPGGRRCLRHLRAPNSLGSSGLDPLGLPEVADLVSPPSPTCSAASAPSFAGRHTVVVGAGHSAANTLLNLAALARRGARHPRHLGHPQHRSGRASRHRPPTTCRPGRRSGAARRRAGRRRALDRRRALRDRRSRGRTGRGRLGARIRANHWTARRRTRDHHADGIVNATGFRPNLDMLREIRLELDEIVEAPRGWRR